MKQLINFILIGSILSLLGACKEYGPEPIGPKGDIPKKLKVVSIENIAGGAKITYALPEEDNLSYVLAEYSIAPGIERKSTASSYLDYLIVEGFPEESDYTISLYAVNGADERSEPAVITINPLLPPIKETFESMDYESGFGGIVVNAMNRFEKNLAFTLLAKNEGDQWEIFDRYFTSRDSITFRIRNMDPIEYELGLFISDEYGNNSDTIFKSLTPIEEVLIPKDNWQVVDLLSDSNTPFYPGTSDLFRLWDWNYNGGFGDPSYFYAHPDDTEDLPNWFTFDLGGTYQLNRVLINQYNGVGEYLYIDGNPKEYEIWGSNVAEDDWNQWTLMVHCLSIKPSGLPFGEKTGEDISYALEGEEFEIPQGMPAVRYIRFKLIDTWSHQPNVLMDEITFWGKEE